MMTNIKSRLDRMDGNREVVTIPFYNCTVDGEPCVLDMGGIITKQFFDGEHHTVVQGSIHHIEQHRAATPEEFRRNVEEVERLVAEYRLED